MAKSVNPKHNPYRPNFFGAFKDIVLRLIDKGQLLIGMVGVILIIAILKMPPNEISKLFHETLGLMESYHVLGWITSAVTTPLFVVIYSRTKNLHQKEVELLNKMIKNKEVH